MRKFTKSTSKKAGSAPGTLVHVGERRAESCRISVIEYSETGFREETAAPLEAAVGRRAPEQTRWVDIDGLHDIEVIEAAGKTLQVHPLTMEDILNTGQRPKVEDYGHYLYIVLRMLHYDEKRDELSSEQVSLILGDNHLISFQERPGDAFEPVRERLRKGRGRIRGAGADYLAYALMDAVVDHYFLILEKIGDRIETLEESVSGSPRPETLREIHYLRREVIYLRKQVWPTREVLHRLEQELSGLIREPTRLFLRDVYDHAIQVIDTIESYRDVLASLLDLYLSTVGNRMNEVMKVLTIIATIFIPITFVAGVYGMNFRFMPELEWRWGYWGVWGLNAAITAGMLLYFRRRRWI